MVRRRGGGGMESVDVPIHLIRSELDLFQRQGTDLSIVSTHTNNYYPSAPLNDILAPLTFTIASSNEHYTDLSKVRLYMRMSVTKADGKPIAKTDIVVPINNICHSAFSQCHITLNEQQITPTSMFYGYRAYFERLLCTTKEFNKTQAALAGYFKEKSPSNSDQTVEDSFKKRFEMSTESTVFEVLGRIHADIFCAGTFLPPGVNMVISLTRAPNAFTLHTSGNDTAFKLNILEAKLETTRVKIQPAVAMSHIRMWEAGHVAHMYLNRVDIKSYGLPTGTRNSINETLICGELPSRMVIAIVNTADMIGNMKANPFIFGGKKLSNINITVNSDSNDSRDLEVCYDEGSLRVKQALHNLYRSLGIDDSDCSIDLSEADFINGRILYVYDFTSAAEEGIPPAKYGNVKIDLTFKTSTTTPLTVLVYTETPSILNIDRNKKVYFSSVSSVA